MMLRQVAAVTMRNPVCAKKCFILCKDGVGDQALQKVLDYACGAGADCTPLLQNGACYNPKTVKDHCSYAVNSYFQKKGQAQGSCDFSGAATTTQTAPASSSGCVYPSSASSNIGRGTSTTPTTRITGTTPSSTTTSTTPTSTSTTIGTITGIGRGEQIIMETENQIQPRLIRFFSIGLFGVWFVFGL